jgi:hypothetical protein
MTGDWLPVRTASGGDTSSICWLEYLSKRAAIYLQYAIDCFDITPKWDCDQWKKAKDRAVRAEAVAWSQYQSCLTQQQ